MSVSPSATAATPAGTVGGVGSGLRGGVARLVEGADGVAVGRGGAQVPVDRVRPGPTPGGDAHVAAADLVGRDPDVVARRSPVEVHAVLGARLDGEGGGRGGRVRVGRRDGPANGRMLIGGRARRRGWGRVRGRGRGRGRKGGLSSLSPDEG